MKKWIESLLPKKPSDTIRPLSARETEELKSEFWRFMDAHPLPSRSPAAAPLRLLPMHSAVFQLAVIAIFIFCGSASFFAVADQADPGELLYAVKRTVNEPMLLGVSELVPAFQVDINTKLLSRRFEDMEKLIASDRFESTDAAALQSDIDEQTEFLHAYIADAEASGETDDALQAGLRLDTLLEAHVTVLNSLERESDAQAFVEETVRKRDRTEDLKENLLEMEATTTDAGTEHISILLEKIEEMHRELASEKEDLQNISNEYAHTEVTEAIEASIKAHQRALEDLAEGNKVSALKELRRAFTGAEMASIILDSYKELNPYFTEKQKK